LRGDTWEWDGADWTQVADTGPDARSGHALAFDAERQRAVLFGGEATGSALRGDTWEWDGGDWTQVADTGPGPSHVSAMTFVGSAILLFGGAIPASPPLAGEELSRLSWEWDGAHWTLRQDMGPAPRWGHALAFDSARGRPVLFGGFSAPPGDPNVAGSVVGDTWEASVEGAAHPDGPGSAPKLQSFKIAPMEVFTTDSNVVTFQVGLDRPAVAGGVLVAISVDGVGVVRSVEVPEGAITGEFTLSPSAFDPPGDYTFTAALAGVTKTATLHSSTPA
jgi:hypothetical protein